MPRHEMTRQTTLSVLVPVYNEQYLVEASLARLRLLGDSPLLERIKVIVVDDHSTDQTPAALESFQRSLSSDFVAGKFEWVFLRHEQNGGKGAAVRTALARADTELAVIHDADLEYHPRNLLQMLPIFLDEGADAVFGSRFLPSSFKRVLFFRHALGNHFLNLICSVVSDLDFTDMETCYKMVRTNLLKSIPLVSDDFRIEPEIAIKLAKRGARIYEIPIDYSGRTYQEGKKIGWKDGVRALWAIAKFGMSDDIYRGDEHGGEILARLNRAPRFNRWMADVVRPYVGHRVLEVGAGTGNLTLNLAPRQVYWATDMNPHYLEALGELRSSRPYLNVQFTDITRAETFPEGQKFDTVICLNVLEHIEDHVSALRNICEALEVGGRAIILVPQHPSLYGSLDRVLGHCRRYTEAELLAVGKQCDFSPSKVLQFNRVSAPGWWLNGKVLGKTTFDLSQMKLLNMTMPLLRRVDRWVPFPALSLIAIFEKTAAHARAAELKSPVAASALP